MLRTISAAHRLFTREIDSKKRLDGLCRIAVEHGFSLAWVGRADEATCDVHVIASAGDHSGYLNNLRVRFDDSALGRGPTGTAIREDRVVVSEHAVDEHLAPWREGAARAGILSSAAAPLRDQSGRVIGALNLYANEAGSFGGGVLALVEELASDVSFVLQAMDAALAQEAARLREHKLLAMIEQSSDWMLALDTDLRLVHSNATARASQLRTLGHVIEPGEHVLESIEPAARDFWQRAYDRALAGETVKLAFPISIRGEQGHVEFQIAPMRASGGAIVGLALVGRDVSASWQSSEALRQSEARFRQLFETSRDGLAETDHQGRYISANAAFLALLGFTNMSELRGKTFRDVTPVEYHALEDHVSRMVIERGFSDEYEKEYVRADGTRIPVRMRVWSRRDAEGRPLGRWVSAHDLRDERRADLELRRMLRAVEQSPVSIVITDASGAIEYANPRFTLVTGYTLDEVRGKNPRFLKSGETPTDVYKDLWSRISKGGIWEGELRNRKKNGDLFWEVAHISPIFDGTGAITGYVAVKQDVTERKLLEEQLRQAQKMEAVGRLAGGVAHDFNNLLTVIRGSGAMLLEDLAVGHPLRELVEEICRAGERATGLTRQLLAFSRRQVLQMRVLDLPTVVTDLGKMLRRLIGEHIELVIRTSAAVAPVKADPGQLEQVIINLAVNARDAMPSGGHLMIETSEIEVQATQQFEHPSVPPGRYALVTVTDTGVGMSEHVRAHLFEPFFTTKEKGKGTGLGLATVHGIVQQTGGHITVDSEVGRGTTFRLFFPVAPADASHVRSQDIALPKRASGTVLLVEDDNTIRNLIRSVLDSRGFEVLVAGNAAEAIKVLEEHPGRIHLVLTDVIMPGGSGATIAARLRELRPTTLLLYMSGYTDDAVLEAGVSGDTVPFIQKPFTPGMLLGKINEVLESAPR